jgi:hypothetical protein
MDGYMDSKQLIKFQSDVLNGRTQEARTFVMALAQERGNQHLQQLALQYGYRNWYREGYFAGYRVILARDLSLLCYENEDISGLGKLLKRYNLMFLTLAGSGHDVQSLLRDHFGLSKHTSQANFVAWPHVLLAGAKGETEFARKMWAYIQEMLTYAEADQESREQTGLGVAENIAKQTRQRMAPDLRIALEELLAKKELLIAMGYDEAVALMEATKHAEAVSGLDLSREVNASPLMLNVPSDTQYKLVSVLEKRFQIPQQGAKAGTHFNKLLERYGLQERLTDGSWQPTARALAERYCMESLQKSGTWSGTVWAWKLDLGARIAEWYRRTGGEEALA